VAGLADRSALVLNGRPRSSTLIVFSGELESADARKKQSSAQEDRVDRQIRRAAWFAGVVWFLSWFELYLEIFRHHHVAVPGFVGVDPSVTGHAGGWVRTVLACSALAPAIFVALHLYRVTLRRPSSSADSPPSPPLPIARAVIGFGLFLCAAGVINQAIRQPPIVVDLTLRTGNGGFVVLGVALAAAGLALRRRRAQPSVH
jgi:hypothetical protein